MTYYNTKTRNTTKKFAEKTCINGNVIKNTVTGNNEPRYSRRYLGDGFSVSNDTRITHLNNNDLIVGSSGSSKTGSIVYAQLKSLKDSSLVVADTKGRLAAMFSKELESKGYEVMTLDLINPENSCRYNPLDYIRRNKDGSFRDQDIAKLAAVLIPDDLMGSEPFWALSARNLLEFFLAYAMATLPPEEQDMYSVCKLYRMYLSPSGELPFIMWVKDHPYSLAAKKYAQISGMKNADRTMASIHAFLNLSIKLFDYVEFESIFAANNDDANDNKSLDLASLGKKKTVLFLNISDNDHSMDTVVNLLYTQILQTLICEADKTTDGRLPVPVRIIMDDFASGSLIPDFDKIISVVRSRDIWLTLCIQSFTQLESLYTKPQAQTVINNCDHIVYLGSNDLDSAEFIGTRAKKTSETILCIDREKEYILESGKPAVLLNKFPPYSFTEEQEETVNNHSDC